MAAVCTFGQWARRLRAAAARLGALGAALMLASCADDAPDPWPGGQPDPSPLLFEITGPQGEVEGWLLGTIHALPDDTQWRTEAIETVIEEADYTLVEIADLGDGSAAGIFATLAASTGLPPLDERVAPEDRAALGELVEVSGQNLDAYDTTETWAAALILAQALRTGDPANGVDRAVIAEFEERGVRELEGSKRQLSIFDGLAEEDQRALLTTVIEDFADGTDQSGELRTAWLTGNATKLEEATVTGMMADPELREALLVARNMDWAEQLGTALEAEERPLVAVGAAHLVGPDGLPTLLEARGYEVMEVGK